MENQRVRISLWIVNRLLNYHKLSLEELSKLWMHNPDSDGSPLSRSQMRHAISAALDSFGVVIECDRSDHFRYYIAANKNQRATEWLISSQAVNRVLGEDEAVRSQILLEEIPSGQFHLSSIIDAMSRRCALEMDYQKFSESSPYTCFIEPYCVKLSRQRWYLLARKDHRDHLQSFALDRILQLRVLFDQPFSPPADFSPHDYFKDFIGVFAGSEIQVCDVLIKANKFQSSYLRTLPIHASQVEVEQREDGSIFFFHVAPTPDFVKELLSYGSNIEVLEPKSVRNQMAEEITRMNVLYNSPTHK